MKSGFVSHKFFGFIYFYKVTYFKIRKKKNIEVLIWKSVKSSDIMFFFAIFAISNKVWWGIFWVSSVSILKKYEKLIYQII